MRLATSSRRPAGHRSAAVGATILAGVLALAPGVHAQSSYTVTTLSGSFSSDHPLPIDTQNRVLGTQTYVAGYRPDPYWFGLPMPYSENRTVQWAQPILGSTVSATRVIGEPGYLAVASPDGNKLVFSKAGDSLFDRATKRIQPLPAGLAYAWGVNNAGTVMGGRTDPAPPGAPVTDGNNPDAWRRALIWTPGQPIVTLPTGSAFTGAGAHAFNEAGVVVGAVYRAPSRQHTRAARWVNGNLEVLDDQPGGGSMALDVGESGHVLVVRWDVEIVPVPSSLGGIYERIDHVNPVYGVIHRGVYTPIASSIAGYGAVASARQVNASGTVIGTLRPDAPNADGSFKPFRAYIWRDGQMQDLTTLVTSKGAKLPAGTVLSVVVSINDQGSLVAGFEHPNTKRQTYVRLQARP